MEGKDIVARARTGSGKTLAYLLPALHKVLSMPRDRQRAGWQALVLVPTRELCEQASPSACQPSMYDTLSNTVVTNSDAYTLHTVLRIVPCSTKLGNKGNAELVAPPFLFLLAAFLSTSLPVPAATPLVPSSMVSAGARGGGGRGGALRRGPARERAGRGHAGRAAGCAAARWPARGGHAGAGRAGDSLRA